MKKLIFILSLFISAVFSGLGIVNAQISEGGNPASFINNLNDSLVDKRVIQSINIQQVMLEDLNRPGPLWAGRSIAVSLNITNSGSWTKLTDGSRIWRLTLISKGAKAIAVCYDDFYIPEGGKLYLYNALKTQVIGAYTYKNNPVNKIFSTEIIQGESVTLEYIEPIEKREEGNKITNNDAEEKNIPSISISEIVHIYRTVPFVEQYSLVKSPQFGTSNACEVNVNCSEGTSWQKQKRGVAEIFLKMGSSWGWCSGDLVNTTNNSGIPYFITADHCHSEGGTTASAADMLQWQFYFQYESSTCSDPSTAPSYNTLTGCVLKASSPINGGSDFCLILLNNTPPQSYNPYYNGWNHTNTGATSGAGIHHPEADIKKISTFTVTLTSDTWDDGTNLGTTNAHWYGYFTKTTNGYGQTEPGSSGSPLFNQNNLQVGTCTGGTAASCSAGSTFYYGKFYYHWDQDGTSSSQQLKPWLDPLGTNPNFINGYDPFLTVPPVANFSASPTTSCTGNIQFTDLSGDNPTSWNWDFGDNSKSTLQNPSHTYTSSGSFDITLKVTNNYGTNTLKKTSYITINLPTSPTTTSATRCGTGTVSLSASGTGTLRWYDAVTGGSLINTGSSYTTPSLTMSTTYYIQNEIPQTTQSVGMTAKTSNGGYYYGTNYTSGWALIFDALSPLRIVSVVVYANSTASRTIWLRNSSGTEIDSLVVNIASGQQTVTLNFDVPAGTGYQLGTNGQNNLWRDKGGAVYPYTISNLISITGNSASAAGYYYYFYNWQVQAPPCLSNRIPVTATINPQVNASVSISANPTTFICKGSPVTFTASPTNGGNTPVYQWKVNNSNAGTNSSLFTSSTLKDGDIITCKLTSNALCVIGSPASSNTITMSVNDIPSAPTAGTNTPSQNSIVWNWDTVAGASGYKWNTTNNYNTSTDNGLSTSVTLTGLTVNTSYTIYVWAYNSCGNSNVISMTQFTLPRIKYSLTGKIAYDNKSGSPINKVTVKIKTTEGLLIDSAITGTDGIYKINNLLSGTYITECTTKDASGGFSPLDALEVNRYYINAYKFADNLRKKAADVNNDKKITPIDALLINRRYIKAINSFPSGDWLFETDSVKITNKDDTLNIKGLCYGDVDASKYGAVKLVNQPLNTRGYINAEINKIIELPIKIDRNTELSAIGLVIGYDIQDLEITDVKSNIDNLIYKITDEEIRIAWTGILNNLNLRPDETLLTLKVKVKTNNNINLILREESTLADNNSDVLSTEILYAPRLTSNLNSKTFTYSYYPNPFKEQTIISYLLPETEKISIKLIDIFGREIETLVNTEQSAGSHQVTIDGSNKQSGIYFYTINTKETHIVQRVMIIK